MNTLYEKYYPNTYERPVWYDIAETVKLHVRNNNELPNSWYVRKWARIYRVPPSMLWHFVKRLNALAKQRYYEKLAMNPFENL